MCSVFLWSLVLMLLVLGLYSKAHIYEEEDPSPKVVDPLPLSDTPLCNLTCRTGEPCQYKDEVDLRIVVMTFDRVASLKTCLHHVQQMDTLEDLVSVDVWVDRSKQGFVNTKVLQVAHAFQRAWHNGRDRRACVHVQDKNAGIYGQWIDTWRPRENSKEIALFLEDDVDISPLAYRWLKAAHRNYRGRSDLAGYTLQMQDVRFFAGERAVMRGPREDVVFMYGVLGTWGFSPNPDSWRQFQDWFHGVRKNKKFKPYVEGIKPTKWYKGLEHSGKAWSMWTMWHIYFCHINRLYTVYSNLLTHTHHRNLLLSWNRHEPGLHYRSKAGLRSSPNLMRTWNAQYAQFPTKTAQLHYNGSLKTRL